MHNACALNIPDSWAVLTRNYFSRVLPFGASASLDRIKRTRCKRNDSRPKAMLRQAELGTLSDLATIRVKSRNSFFFFSLKALRISSLPLTQQRNCRGRRDWHLNHYTTVGVPRAAHNAAKWFALECKPVIHFFSGRMRDPPYAGCRLFVISTIARCVLYVSKNLIPHRRIPARPFFLPASTLCSLFLFFFFCDDIKNSCGWERN